jgi:hypothetical protein
VLRAPPHLILLDLITRLMFGDQYISLSSSLCSFLHSPVQSSLLGPNILLSNLFSNTVSLRSLLHVSDQVSHPYRTTDKIIFLLLLLYTIFLYKITDDPNLTLTSYVAVTNVTTCYHNVMFFCSSELCLLWKRKLTD